MRIMQSNLKLLKYSRDISDPEFMNSKSSAWKVSKYD